MVLEYDFDIVVVDPGDGGAESGRDGFVKKPVLRAMFRNVNTADALRATSPKIRKIFQDAGFGLDATGSELSSGLYRPRDEAERERILRALFANVREMGVKGEYCGEFDFRQFLMDVKTARPRNGQRRQVADWTPKPRSGSMEKPERRTVPARIGLALGLAVVIFVILKYLAESGSAP